MDPATSIFQMIDSADELRNFHSPVFFKLRNTLLDLHVLLFCGGGRVQRA